MPNPLDLFALLRGRQFQPPSPDLLSMLSAGQGPRPQMPGQMPMAQGWPASRWQTLPKPQPPAPSLPPMGSYPGMSGQMNPTRTDTRTLPPQANANPRASQAINSSPQGPQAPPPPSPPSFDGQMGAPSALTPPKPKRPQGY